MKNLLFIGAFLISASTLFALPGDLDTTFGVKGGYVVSDFLGTQTAETVNDVVVQPDGKIIIAGSVRPSNETDFLVARYNPDGTLDTIFSGDGERPTTAHQKDLPSPNSIPSVRSRSVSALSAELPHYLITTMQVLPLCVFT
jgi:uncharacterized delta-60 repeat protein